MRVKRSGKHGEVVNFSGNYVLSTVAAEIGLNFSGNCVFYLT